MGRSTSVVVCSALSYKGTRAQYNDGRVEDFSNLRMRSRWEFCKCFPPPATPSNIASPAAPASEILLINLHASEPENLFCKNRRVTCCWSSFPASTRSELCAIPIGAPDRDEMLRLNRSRTPPCLSYRTRPLGLRDRCSPASVATLSARCRAPPLPPEGPFGGMSTHLQ